MEKTTNTSNVFEKLEKKAFTVQEAANMLDVAPMTILRAIKNGKIKAIQLSPHGRYRISVDAWETFMKQTEK